MRKLRRNGGAVDRNFKSYTIYAYPQRAILYVCVHNAQAANRKLPACGRRDQNKSNGGKHMKVSGTAACTLVMVLSPVRWQQRLAATEAPAAEPAAEPAADDLAPGSGRGRTGRLRLLRGEEYPRRRLREFREASYGIKTTYQRLSTVRCRQRSRRERQPVR